MDVSFFGFVFPLLLMAQKYPGVFPHELVMTPGLVCSSGPKRMADWENAPEKTRFGLGEAVERRSALGMTNTG